MAPTTPNDYTCREEQITKHLFEVNSTYSLYDTDAEFTSLTAGAPGPDLLAKCCEIFEVATRQRMISEKDDAAILFQYGPSVGRFDFRQALAKFLSAQYRSEVNCNDLIQTTGATQGLHLVLSTMVDFGGVIFVDEVTYMIALRVIGQFSTLKIVTVPLTNDGVDVIKLRELVAAHQFVPSSKPFWGIYYTTTVHHNPTGLTFTEDVCREIVKISREFELLVITEDVYNMLTYTEDGVPPTRLFALDRMEDPDYRGNIISNGTFSKILAPGTRVGWMECPPRCVRLFASSGILNSGGATNNYTAGVLTTMLDMGLVQELLSTNRPIYKERMLSAVQLLRTHLPNDCQFQAPTGGYFIWIRFPEHVNVHELNAFARKHYRVSAIGGSDFSAENNFKNCIRISIAFFGGKKLDSALMDLCRAYKNFAGKLKL